MKPEELAPGAIIKVPSGAGTLTHSYYLRVGKVRPSQVEGSAHVHGDIVRADGSPSRRKHSGRADFVIVEQLVLVAPPGEEER